jgi:hypothetical protein
LKLDKTRLAVWLVVAVTLQMLVCPLTFCSASHRYGKEDAFKAILPRSLLRVEEEAFEGTVFRSLSFEDGLLWIGDRAFSNMEHLRDIWLPGSTAYIADTAFSHSSLVRIHGKDGTYVQKWAEEHQIKFEAYDSWYIAPHSEYIYLWLLLPLFAMPCPNSDGKRIRQYIRSLVISMRPQDRPELYPINYRFP